MIRPENINRAKNFKRNQTLEEMLAEINNDLWVVEQKLYYEKQLEYPVIFIVGPLRSGTTLMMQWLASSGIFSYPTNLLSRFYHAPIIGSKIQLLLSDERYNYRDELLEFSSEINFSSENGKTKGALAPNEFWYFWRRFLPFKDLDYLPTDELLKISDTHTMVSEFAGIMDVFQKPFALKAMILNYNIDFLDKLFDKAIFIYTRRDPITNIESALKARERQLGNIDKWYSFKIPEYTWLKDISDPIEQTTGQIYCINRAVENGLSKVRSNKKITVEYEEFCRNPRKVYNILINKLKEQGFNSNDQYRGPASFNISRKKEGDLIKKIEKYYEEFRTDQN